MRVRVLSSALDEISQAALWYDSQRAGLGSEFWQAVDAALRQIEENPTRFARSEFATQDIDFRFAMIKRFHYVIHFAVEQDDVQVAAVAHAAVSPAIGYVEPGNDNVQGPAVRGSRVTSYQIQWPISIVERAEAQVGHRMRGHRYHSGGGRSRATIK